MFKKYLVLFYLILLSNLSFSQEERLSDNNTIGWVSYVGAFKVKPKLSIHTEYQWRRVDGFKNWQQGLARVGINYAIRKDISLIAGYAFAGTYIYGDYPPAFSFPEHRLYQQVVIKNPIGRVDISHRFTLEQRFMGRVSMLNGEKNTSYFFLNRMRYRIRAEIPLTKKEAQVNNWYIALQDEVFIGWGKNMGNNIFDQNRMGVLLGYKANKNIKLEAGYLNQYLQQARRINNKAVYQYNNGFLLSANFNIDLVK